MSQEHFVTIGTGIETRALLERLEQHPELWAQTPRERYPGSAHAQVQSIPIRWVPLPQEDLQAAVLASNLELERVSRALVEQVLGSTEAVDYPAAQILMPEIGDAVMDTLAGAGYVGEIGHVHLTRLPPGGSIAKHADEGLYSELYDRFHLCLQGDAGNVFECGGVTIRPEPGEAFWFNHKLEHQVRNEGATERIHLIVDAIAPDFTRRRGLYFQAERPSDCFEEVKPLLELHADELRHYRDIPLEPDWAAYQAMEDRGELRAFSARDCGRLVGYAVFFVRPNHHYRSSLQAHQDILYVHPAYRTGTTGLRLIWLAEKRLAAQGVQVVYHHAKRTNKTGELLGRLGYDLVDEIWAKRLDAADKKKGR